MELADASPIHTLAPANEIKSPAGVPAGLKA
jgi:hypothetical protein